MNDSNANSTNGDVSLLGITLGEVPNTDGLKSRILQKTAQMPQLNGETAEVKGNAVPFVQKKYIAPFALAASVALMAVLFVPTNTTEQTIVAIESVDIDTVLSEDDFIFEEAMLFEDELMFAQL